MTKLIAIPYPAPSIPKHFRLYHGGSAWRGKLATQAPDSLAYLGDYVYFSTEKHYAAKYVKSARDRDGLSRPRRTARLFVIDARALPGGTRVVDLTGRPESESVEHCLFELIELFFSFRPLLEKELTLDDRRSILASIYRRIQREPFLGAGVVDRYLSSFPEPGLEQIKEARNMVSLHWVETLTRALTLPFVSGARIAADSARAQYRQENGDKGTYAVNGSIVLVPGPIPVLKRGWRGIDRSEFRRQQIQLSPDE